MNASERLRLLLGLRTAFRRTFNGPDGKPHADARVVLNELRRFCYGARPTIKNGTEGLDPFASIAAAARQEVYFRILGMLNLDDSDLHLMQKRIEEGQADA